MTDPIVRDAILQLWAAEVEIARAKKAMSQAKLARLADTDPGTLNKFLNGADVRTSTACRILDAAGLEVVIREKLPKSA